MSTATNMKTVIPNGLDARVLARIIQEGYGPGAWHGPDLRAALGDVSAELAFRRPSAGRHNIAEIALHHAYYVRSVRGQLSGLPLEPFAMEGDDWFSVSGDFLSWPSVQEILDSEQQRLADVVGAIVAGRTKPVLTDTESFDLLLGITCHAIYHAGQIQLIKKMSDK